MSDHLNYTESRWNGWNGNECVYKKDYVKAIEYYSTAIELYPLEYRYFVNRSFCFDHLQRFELALEDAQRALLLQSDWGKCYYRKARALKGLKRLEEAEICFLKVIELEGNDCKEAKNELKTLRESLPTDSRNNSPPNINPNPIQIKSESKDEENNKKCDKTSSKILFSKTNESEIFTNEVKSVKKVNGSEPKNKILVPKDDNREKNLLKELSDFLLNTNVLPINENKSTQQMTNCHKKYIKSEIKSTTDNNKPIKTVDNELKTKNNRRHGRKGMDEIVEIWDDSRNHWSPTSSRAQNMVSSRLLSFRKTEPTNPWAFRGLQISNIRPTEETKQVLRHVLSEYGKITLIDLVPERDSAIINFDNPESPRIAMSYLQGEQMPNICLHNQKLKIRFRPLNDSKNYPSLNCLTEHKLNNECYFWRTTGCNQNRFCKLKHIAANKGVDLQPWMQTNTNKYKYRRQNRNRFQLI